ncbi:hypothetical protein ACTI_73210 [Actinoplanes sp. OR16]|uniref:hypothetical protein n=1 Tax=Actinoplanes sp. OR16 TaxID=946334 RepID=UPI000F71B744|nr:hypothetical protein [Actinoplanes sp. OR16]BBH70636.1 hypothetical protein ACTI_73210 [Actinoplanes sp. OR16]
MKIQFRLLIAVVVLVFGLPVPVLAAPAPTPWTPPAADVVESEPYYYDELDAADYDIPEWMFDEDYLDALPAHGFRKKKANRNSDEFEGAYSDYFDAMIVNDQRDGIVTRDQFWESFKPGGWNHLLTGWRDYKGPKTWPEWLAKTVEVLNRGKAGGAYEVHYNKRNAIDKAHGFVAVNQKIRGVNLEWQKDNPQKREVGKNRVYRVDSYHPNPTGASRGVVGERKSGPTLNPDEFLNVTVEVAAQKNADIEITFGDTPNAEALRVIAKAEKQLLARRIELHGAKGAGASPIVVKTWRAEARGTRPASASSLLAGAQRAWPSRAVTAMQNSATSAADAKDDEEIEKAVAEDLADEEETAPAKICQLGRSPCHTDVANAVPAVVYDNDEIGAGTDQLGGVDFSTLELRYISDTYAGAPGVKYSYSVDPDPKQKVSYGGADAARLASDSFFTWLALPPTAFTVNLNPEEPNRIVDSRFGRTDAGRVLLEADFQMKKTVAKLIHPDTRAGKKFWDSLRGEQSCINMRQWIVPAPAIVRDDGNELFILDAPLQVKMETEYENLSGSETCPGQATADTLHNEKIYRSQILPGIVKAVNNAPEYADLRRVYASRVAAQWYRERSATKVTAYADIVDSGDITPWVTRTSWKPKNTFDAYVKSYKKGEFRVKHTTRKGNYIYTNTYVYGGVDFTQTPTSNMEEPAFTAKNPKLRTAVADLTGGPVADSRGTLWFGQESNELPRDEALSLPPSPVSKPLFWLLTLLPVVVWLLVTALIVIRRGRAVTR